LGYIVKNSSVDEFNVALQKIIDGEFYFEPKNKSKICPSHLTRRQIEILEHVRHGRSSKEIARNLNISHGTVDNHISSIMSALNAKDRTHAVCLGLQLGYISLNMKYKFLNRVFELPSQVAFVATLVLIAVIFGVTAMQLSMFRSNLEATLFAEQDALTTSVANNLDQQLITLKNALTASANAITESDLYSNDAAQSYLDTNTGLNALFERSVFLFSPDGHLIAERPFLPDRRGKNFGFRDYIKNALKTNTVVISDPFVTTKNDKNHVIMFATPVFSKVTKKIIAITSGSFGLTHPKLLGNIANTVIGKTGFMYLVTKDGRLVMHPNRSLLLNRAYEKDVNPAFEKALAGFQGAVKSIEHGGYASISTFKKINSTGWILVSVYPESEAFELFNKLVNNLILVFFVSALIACTLVWTLSNHLVRKIQSKNKILRKIKDESLISLRVRSKFFNEASHDLQQRLYGIQLLVNVAERACVESDKNSAIKNFKSSVADLERYFDNFLEFTRIETVCVRPEFVEFPLQRIFQKINCQFEYFCEDVNVNLKTRHTNLICKSDEKIVYRILENLVSNALKFSRNKVLVVARKRKNTIELSVIDNGCGMSETEIPKIFSEFFQGENKSKPNFGFGLGLGIVARLTNILGAKLTIRSKPNLGTRVNLTIPLQ
jgi:signal transduction histidine kinase/DNA-binding CsgD family transcriptional regulator